jgi:hypothetical protein
MRRFKVDNPIDQFFARFISPRADKAADKVSGKDVKAAE